MPRPNPSPSPRPEWKAEFEERGFVRLRGAFSAEAARAMEERTWDSLGRRFGVCPNDPSTWTVPLGLGLQPLRKHAVFRALGGDATFGALDELLGPDRWVRPKHWGQLLVSFPAPGAEAWTVPARLWHTDFPYAIPADRLCGVLLFSFISRVPDGHGGTAVVAGSPRVIRGFLEERPHLKRLKMKVARRALLDSDPWFRALLDETEAPGERIDRFVHEEGRVRDVPVRVVELTGEPGVVILGHPWLLHAPAPNCGDHPRFMSVQRIRLAP